MDYDALALESTLACNFVADRFYRIMGDGEKHYVGPRWTDCAASCKEGQVPLFNLFGDGCRARGRPASDRVNLILHAHLGLIRISP